MRLQIAAALGMACCLPALGAQSEATVAQLKWFLNSGNAHRKPDGEVAAQLSRVVLTERLSEATVPGLVVADHLGAQSAEALEALAAESQLRETPRSEWMQSAAPDAESQRAMAQAMRAYARGVVGELPDFLALRMTRMFENAPIDAGRPDKKPSVRLHFSGERRREVTYRAGHEVVEGASAHPGARDLTSSTSFENWGEFGPVLRMLMSDSVAGSLRWDHWEDDGTGRRLAVFHYAVPQSASHYLADFCCFEDESNFEWHGVHDKPAYHGDVFFDPETNTVAEITLEADLPAGGELTESGLAVRYGWVEIGGKRYICPVRSVAVSANRDFRLEAIDHIGVDRHINDERFTGYHKFGSDARIVTAAQ